jgi:hypothetical protein
MSNFQYILEPFDGKKTRHICPYCGKENVFVRYINIDNNEYLNDSVGRCNREVKCGQHYTPKQYFTDNNIGLKTPLNYRFKPLNLKKPLIKPFSKINSAAFIGSLKHYDLNNFVDYLSNKVGHEQTMQAVNMYNIGTSKFWSGATVFWQMDVNGEIRTGKIIHYDPITGKRTKEPTNRIQWVHSALKLENFNLQQCFFGEHLIKRSNKPIAIVESEKTAVIASLYLPRFTWIAAGAKNGLNRLKCEVLKGKQVVLYPDLKCYDDWNKEAKKLSDIFSYTISDLLEKKATNEEREKGLDLADYLTRFDINKFK